MRQWRLIVDQPTTGTMNMAIDDAILQSVAAGSQPPTLRLYGWNPLCLSIGYGQRLRDVDLGRLDTRGWGLVRRPTGGKAILHGDEVTYSVALPADHDLAQGDVIESYRRISEALLHALELLGLQPASEKKAKGTKGLGPVCFEVPSHYEITVNNKKLIGSAQVRRKIGILQHGTLPLYGDITRICDGLAYDNEEMRRAAKQQVAQRATTLAAVTGTEISWEHTAEALAQGFAEAFNLDLVQQALSLDEKQCAAQLRQETYATSEWMTKR